MFCFNVVDFKQQYTANILHVLKYASHQILSDVSKGMKIGNRIATENIADPEADLSTPPTAGTKESVRQLRDGTASKRKEKQSTLDVMARCKCIESACAKWALQKTSFESPYSCISNK
jgi:hypothetical protein